jgi:hypothetical protein
MDSVMRIPATTLRAIADCLDQLAQLKSIQISEFRVAGYIVKLDAVHDQRDGTTLYVVDVQSIVSASGAFDDR